MFNSVLKKVFGLFMIVLGIIFLFVPVIPSSPFFILGAISLGLVTKDYIKRKLLFKKDCLKNNKNAGREL